MRSEAIGVCGQPRDGIRQVFCGGLDQLRGRRARVAPMSTRHPSPSRQDGRELLVGDFGCRSLYRDSAVRPPVRDRRCNWQTPAITGSARGSPNGRRGVLDEARRRLMRIVGRGARCAADPTDPGPDRLNERMEIAAGGGAREARPCVFVLGAPGTTARQRSRIEAPFDSTTMARHTVVGAARRRPCSRARAISCFSAMACCSPRSSTMQSLKIDGSPATGSRCSSDLSVDYLSHGAGFFDHGRCPQTAHPGICLDDRGARAISSPGEGARNRFGH